MSLSPHPDVEKRVLDNGSPTTMSSKRRKVVNAEINTKGESNGKVDPSELASAFALASLASLKSTSSDGSETREEKHKGHSADKEVRKAASYEETRSPKVDKTPLSPEQRSLGSAKSRDDTAASDDELSATNRRVHFSPCTKQSNVAPSTPISRPPPIGGRRLAQPPPRTPPISIHRATLTPQPVRHPYAMNAFMHHPSVSPQHRLHHHHHSPHAFHHASPQGWYGARVYPPQRLMQPPLMHPESQWICDFCNVAAFATYEEACAHEETCKHSLGIRRHTTSKGVPPTIQETQSGSFMSRTGSGEEDASLAGSTTMAVDIRPPSSPSSWFKGTMCLAMEESDREWLSELNCYIRSHCVEAFSATDDDVSRSSKRGRISLHQVGIRCRHCASMPPKNKAVAAVSFPTSIGGIYESVKRWQRVHVEVCEAVPQGVRNTLAALSNTNVWVPTTRQYWTDSAKALGLVDTHEGIRFGIDPKEIAASRRGSMDQHSMPHGPRPGAGSLAASGGTTGQGSQPAGGQKKNVLVDYIVFPDDMEMIPSYVYFLMRQVEPCQFTEADRFVARSKGPVGYPGFQCRHCNGHAGLGKYFPVSAKSLSTNSTSQNIHAHLLKCRKCPEQVKDRLVQLKIEKSRSPRLEPGWRKVFFDKVWERLHG